MAVIIRQDFPLGRFHATPWRQSVFDTQRGEWPPSPWRLMRALAARWFQFSRETGQTDSQAIQELLTALGSQLPEYYLPAEPRRGPAIRQYQPTRELAWSDPAKGSGAVKQSRTTLVPDQYQIVGEDPIYWIWSGLDLPEALQLLLGELLKRTLYFGRQESFCRMTIGTETPPQPNCRPRPDLVPGSGPFSSAERAAMPPVLAASPGQPLRLDSLLAETDDALLRNSPVPPGTILASYLTPDVPEMTGRDPERIAMLEVPYIQFAIGGRVYPTPERWIKVPERLRGCAAKRFAERFGIDNPRYALLLGKAAGGLEPLRDHQHAYFVVWEDSDKTLRLIVWRRSVCFDRTEQLALSEASEAPISWREDLRPRDLKTSPEEDRRRRSDPWTVRLVELPARTDLPRGFAGPSAEWQSVTPFVPPGKRHPLRKNGKVRESETPSQICARLVERATGHRPLVEVVSDAPVWTKLHEPRAAREERRAKGQTGSLVRPGWKLHLKFSEPIKGPIIVGDSCHFGVGLFAASDLR